jgi:hypothetical protein
VRDVSRFRKTETRARRDYSGKERKKSRLARNENQEYFLRQRVVKSDFSQTREGLTKLRK